MHNFGRGMWRRVGDYERIQKPMILQQAQMEKIQQFVEYQAVLKKQKEIKEYLAKKHMTVITEKHNEVKDKTPVIVEEISTIAEETPTIIVEPVIQQTNKIDEPKKSKKKHKNNH